MFFYWKLWLSPGKKKRFPLKALTLTSILFLKPQDLLSFVFQQKLGFEAVPHWSCGSVALDAPARAHLPWGGVRSPKGEMMTQLRRYSPGREASLQLSQSCQSKVFKTLKKYTANVGKSNMFHFKIFCKIIYLVIRSVPQHFWGPLKLPQLKMEAVTPGHRRPKLIGAIAQHCQTLPTLGNCKKLAVPPPILPLLKHLSSSTCPLLLPKGTKLTRACCASLRQHQRLTHWSLCLMCKNCYWNIALKRLI